MRCPERFRSPSVRSASTAQREPRAETRAGDPAQGTRPFRQGDDPVSRFRFVSDHQSDYGPKRLCRVVGVSRSGYDAWKKRPPCPHATRRRAALRADRRDPQPLLAHLWGPEGPRRPRPALLEEAGGTAHGGLGPGRSACPAALAGRRRELDRVELGVPGPVPTCRLGTEGSRSWP